MTPRGEGLKWKGSPKSYPDPYHLLPSKNVSGSYSESKKKKANTKPKLKPYGVLYKALIRVLGLMNTKQHKLFLFKEETLNTRSWEASPPICFRLFFGPYISFLNEITHPCNKNLKTLH